MIEAPDCKLFVDADMGAQELVALMTHVISEVPIRCELEIIQNEDYDSRRRSLFPDGFIYFRYLIDLYIPDEKVRRQAKLVTFLLNYLWESGFPAVAACAFEAQLPEHGGYKSQRIPWPQP